MSKTEGDFGGLGPLVRIAALGVTDSRVPALRFKTAPFAMSLPLAKLERFEAYYRVGDTEGVVVLARRVDSIPCPRGFIKGE